MIEVVTILALIALLAFQEYHNRKERSKLVNAILAKNVNDFKDMELADKTKIEIKPPKPAPFLDSTQLTDEDWFKTEIEGKKLHE